MKENSEREDLIRETAQGVVENYKQILMSFDNYLNYMRKKMDDGRPILDEELKVIRIMRDWLKSC